MCPKTSSARGNERGNKLLFQKGERAGVRVERREKELNCEGEDMPRGEVNSWSWKCESAHKDKEEAGTVWKVNTP